ncbi:unnamed protein product [Zymoseptoria tritici ST99CH_3D7]|uniref:Uncharacterized protein n=1 Tax=Zymoseptoria tritici (strain ST99CH_3D7) TaxID=1276538 RepID=A0A1X7RL66_ZYMT9|nr:unnamed protein product [Zymoseptoria tritici ST99CH_3D7]
MEIISGDQTQSYSSVVILGVSSADLCIDPEADSLPSRISATTCAGVIFTCYRLRRGGLLNWPMALSAHSPHAQQ